MKVKLEWPSEAVIWALSNSQYKHVQFFNGCQNVTIQGVTDVLRYPQGCIIVTTTWYYTICCRIPFDEVSSIIVDGEEYKI